MKEIILNLDSDSSWYTITSARKIEARYIRQASSMDCFAIVNLEVKPYLNKKIAVFNNQITEIHLENKVLYPQKNNDIDTIEIVNIITQGVIIGIEKACLDLSQKSYLIGGIAVTGTSAIFHLVDSQSRCYETATYLALLKVFDEVNLIKI